MRRTPFKWTRGRLAAAAVLTVGLVALGVTGALVSQYKKPAVAVAARREPVATATTAMNATAPPVTTGDYDYTLEFMPHKKGVIIDGGFPKGSTPEQKKQIVADAAAHDPFVLHYFLTRIYSGVKDVPSAKELENTDLRIKYHQKLLVLLEASNFKNVSLEGKTFFNEGVNGSRMVTASNTTYGQGVEGTEISMGGNTSTVKNNCVNKQNVAAPRNVIILPPSKEGKPPKKMRPCPPVTDVGKPSNPTYEPPSKNVAPPTKGYEPGNAEDVAKDQERDEGKDGPTEHGSRGEDSGSSTNPDGSKDTAPPPTADPGPSYPGDNDHEEPITD